MPQFVADHRPRHILVGVTGGIAAYKACFAIRLFKEAGDDVTVIPTESALKFVGAATFEALSGNTVSTEVFDGIPDVRHIRLGHEADLVVVMPATADFLARAASGRADDLLTTTLLSCSCPVVMAPAMHTQMWNHPATQDNVRLLRSRGTTIINPAVGRLTGRDSGVGRLPEPEEVVALSQLILDDADALKQDLIGLTCVISAGGTREPLDPVRFLGNSSSGKQGIALAQLAAQRGANVTLVLGAHNDVHVPSGIRVVNVSSANDMHETMTQYATTADIVMMVAAVADFRPATVAAQKMKKGQDSEPSSIPLIRNPDILKSLVDARSRGDIAASATIVGFAAETGDHHADVLHYGMEKRRRKQCDLLVVNPVGYGRAFGTDDNTGWIVGPEDSVRELPRSSKLALASRILDTVADYRMGHLPH